MTISVVQAARILERSGYTLHRRTWPPKKYEFGVERNKTHVAVLTQIITGDVVMVFREARIIPVLEGLSRLVDPILLVALLSEFEGS